MTNNLIPRTENLIPRTKNLIRRTKNLISEAENLMTGAKNLILQTENSIPGTENLIPRTKNLIWGPKTWYLGPKPWFLGLKTWVGGWVGGRLVIIILPNPRQVLPILQYSPASLAIPFRKYMTNYSPSRLQDTTTVPSIFKLGGNLDFQDLNIQHIVFRWTRHLISAKWEGVQLVAFNLAQSRPREPFSGPMRAQHAAAGRKSGNWKLKQRNSASVLVRPPASELMNLDQSMLDWSRNWSWHITI